MPHTYSEQALIRRWVKIEVPIPSVFLDAVAVVATIHGVTDQALLSPGRRINAELRRMVVGLVDGFEHGLSLPEIGQCIGRDHSTVVVLLGRHRASMEATPRTHYALVFDKAKMCMQRMGYPWLGPSERRGADAARRLAWVRDRYRRCYSRAAREHRAAA